MDPIPFEVNFWTRESPAKRA